MDINLGLYAVADAKVTHADGSVTEDIRSPETEDDQEESE